MKIYAETVKGKRDKVFKGKEVAEDTQELDFHRERDAGRLK